VIFISELRIVFIDQQKLSFVCHAALNHVNFALYPDLDHQYSVWCWSVIHVTNWTVEWLADAEWHWKQYWLQTRRKVLVDHCQLLPVTTRHHFVNRSAVI